jgi:hypothetical protein
VPDPDWGAVRDERGRKLATVLPEVGSSMRFDYDFGDGWEHDVVVEAIEPAQRSVRYPRLLAGKWACPPEDCGGPWGYQNLPEALADPKHPDHGDLTERGVAMLASDVAQDPTPTGYRTVHMPIHMVGIVAMGLWLIDNCQLEDLAATCERLDRWEFQFALAPIRFQGVTGTPVNPLAVF